MTQKHNNDPLNNLEIVGEGFDDLGRRYIKLRVNGSDHDLPPYSMGDIVKPDKIYRDLSNVGCNFFSRQSQRKLLDLLQGYEQRKPSFTVVTRLGAFRDFYVRPDGIIGKPSLPVERALGSLEPHMLEKYRCRGSLESWQKQIGKLCVGNSRLMFAASLACTGPTLSFVSGPRTGGFQISGRAESGKTAMAMVAGSIWGCHRDSMRKDKGFAESWNSTGNKLEHTAQAHSDALYIPDETNLAGATEKERATSVLSSAFRLSETTRRGRLNEAGTAAWRFFFLSTSNLTLDELAAQGGVPIDDQHRGRLVDIGLPRGLSTHGIYQELHGFSDGANLTDTIKTRCRTIFGAPGYELVRRIYERRAARSKAKRFVATRRNAYLERARRKAINASAKPLERATARFATVYAAGCLAIKYGIFTWHRKGLLKAVLSCQFESIQPIGEPSLPDRLRARLIAHLLRYREQFFNLNEQEPVAKAHKLGSVRGYTQTYRNDDWIYLTSDQLKSVIGADRPARQLKQALVAEGMLAAAGKRALVQRPLFKGKGNKGFRWVHAFRTSLLAS